MDHSVIWVPHWVVDTLQRHRLPLTTVLDFPKLRKVLSGGDLAAISYLNDNYHKFLLTDHSKSKHNEEIDVPIGDSIFPLYSAWYSSGDATDQAWLDTTLGVLKKEAQTVQNLTSRLFDPSPQAWRPTDAPEEKPFIIYDLNRTVSMVSIQAGYFTSKVGVRSRQLQLELVQAILKVLYAYMPYNTLARTSWFRHYLCLLNPYRAG